jgi:hypothetical protein
MNASNPAPASILRTQFTILATAMGALAGCAHAPIASSSSTYVSSEETEVSVEKRGLLFQTETTKTLDADAQRQLARDTLAKEFREASDYVNRELARLEKDARGNTRNNLALTGTGILAGVATAVLTAANPAANAAWITGTSALSTGMLSFRSARGVEGLSALAISEQYNRILAEVKTARGNYDTAYIALSGETDLKVFNTQYAKAQVAINQMIHAVMLRGIALGNEAEPDQIKALSDSFQSSLTQILASIQYEDVGKARESFARAVVAQESAQSAYDAAPATPVDQKETLRNALANATKARVDARAFLDAVEVVAKSRTTTEPSR